jgi:cardiolipin synthase
MLYELARARRRGVDVRIILPAEGNHETMNRSNKIAINTMLKNGIRVYLYPGMTHIKAAVYDGWACTGSANFDKMSLEINKELNLSTSDRDTVNTLLERLFIPDMERSEELYTAPETNWTHRLAEIVADEML